MAKGYSRGRECERTAALIRACAYVVGPEDGPGAAIADVARSLGFAAVHPWPGLQTAEQQSQQTPLIFLLFAEVDEARVLKPVADAVRFSPSRRLRFSPLVYFSESPQADTIRQCIGMGFDDVITMPFTLPRVSERLGRLVDRVQVYSETASYLGPERREGEGDSGEYRRLELIRKAESGVSVLRDEMRIAL